MPETPVEKHRRGAYWTVIRRQLQRDPSFGRGSEYGGGTRRGNAHLRERKPR